MENALLRCGYDSKEVAKLRFTVIDRRKRNKKNSTLNNYRNYMLEKRYRYV